MGATSFLRSLSRLPTVRRSTNLSMVTPLPAQSQFSEEVTEKLNALRASECEYASASWLVEVLDATILTQKVAQEQVIKSASNVTLSKLDKETIESYLEDNIELLDACNGLVEKIDVIHKYDDTLQSIVRSLAIEGRSQEILKECSKVEAQCAALDKCSPKLCRLMGRKETTHVYQGEQDLELHEALSGSREVASMSCNLFQRALSFKSRQGLLKSRSKLSTTWSSSLNELQVALNDEAERRKK
uniref:Uncharacterized protein n=1 Tax=Chenopodium quinoa TaxID=63459 RepID=A0A803L4Z9_CHEQI